MTDETPISCSLSTSDLQGRLATIAELGAESLVGHDTEGQRHLLRFRSEESTRRRLEQIVEAEARCCPFLELALDNRDGELVLSIAAPGEGQPVADELTATFAGERR
jgi:hypothetical protein